jgi:quinol monooxygenase YgiN
MFQLFMRMRIRPENRSDLIRTVRTLAGPVGVEPGCRRFDFYTDTDNENAFALVEEWDSLQDLEEHLCKDNFRLLLTVLELSSEAPEIKFYTSHGPSGMEAIRSAREKYLKRKRTDRIPDAL